RSVASSASCTRRWKNTNKTPAMRRYRRRKSSSVSVTKRAVPVVGGRAACIATPVASARVVSGPPAARVDLVGDGDRVEADVEDRREHRVERDARQRLVLQQRPRRLLDRAPVALQHLRRAPLGLLDDPLGLLVDDVERVRADRAELLQRRAEEDLAAG